jgi:hypothetical protein
LIQRGDAYVHFHSKGQQEKTADWYYLHSGGNNRRGNSRRGVKGRVKGSVTDLCVKTNEERVDI